MGKSKFTLAAIAVCFLCAMSSSAKTSTTVRPRPLIIAHRGASAECPENTLASVRRAWEVDADAVEIDVHPTGDGRALVIHDATTSRTTGKDFVVSATTSAILRELDAGAWKSVAFAGEKLPFLEEVLDTVPRGKLLFVELKGDLATIPPVAKVLHETKTTEGIVLISFNLEMLKQMKRDFPSLPAYWLRSTVKDATSGAYLPHPKEWWEQAAQAGLDGIDVHYAGLHPAFIAAAKKKGLKVFVWTVNDVAKAEELSRMGVDGITTDKPRELLTKLGTSLR